MKKVLTMSKITDADGMYFIEGRPNVAAWNAMTKSMDRNNTFCPGITRVIFNLKTTEEHAKRDSDGKLVIDPATNKPVREVVKLDRPILATTVYFNDETKVTVVNSEHDRVGIDEHGNADVASKEAGIVYAIAKRLIGCPDKNGTIDGDGFGRRLRDLVDGAYDCQIEAKKNKELKAKNKAEYAAKLNSAKPKAKKYSIRCTLDRINAVLDKYENKQM